MSSRRWSLTAALLLAACTDRQHPIGAGPVDGPAGGSAANGGGAAGASGGGVPGAGGAGGAGPAAMDDSTPGGRQLVRLTNAELANTWRDLLGEPAPVAVMERWRLPDQRIAGSPFPVGAFLTTTLDISAMHEIAVELARRAVERPGLAPAVCPPGLAPADRGAEDECARQFIQRFGQRAFRRPLTPAEEADLFALYQVQRGPELAGSLRDGLRVLIAGMLQSPPFLYHGGEGARPPLRDGPLVRLDGWEIASRLSYFLWSSMPDDVLFQAAAEGALGTPDQIAQQARRMVADPRAGDAVRAFALTWLEVDESRIGLKHPAFTGFTPELGRLLVQETADFAAGVLVGPGADGKLSTLLTSSTSSIDPVLAAFYGVAGVTGAGPHRAALPVEQRAGILTLGGFPAAHATERVEHPMARGVAVLRRLLCEEIDVPPDQETPVLPDPRPGEPYRDDVAALTSPPACRFCHARIDPAGFAFQHYDATGAFRATELGRVIDASGSLAVEGGAGARTVTWLNAIDLSRKLADLPAVQACVGRHWMRWLLRRHEQQGEQPALNAALAAAGAGTGAGLDLRELLVALTRTRVFTHRALSEGEVQP